MIAQKPANSDWRSLLRRYSMLCRVSFQERMEYRWNILFYVIVTIVPALIAMYLWTTVFAADNNPTAVRDICTYYVVATFVTWRIAEFQWNMMQEIRDGKMANSLLRPMSYPAKLFWYEVGGRTWSTILTLPVFIILAFALGDNFKMPDNFGTWLLAILAFLIAYVLNSYLTMMLGLLTIWQNQPEGIFAVYWTLARWFGGSFVPLAFMPGGIGEVLEWLPFAYVYTLPVRIFQGLPPEKMLQGFAVQIIWLVVIGLAFRWTWQKALNRYEVFEG